ncbi:unnamed protein product [Orchesella dallaii]|uniref:Uncharacterized protein n=1 Tax=Orchesella dallaii TaxID=48710 RepID=A0ABP1R181_9HEXA
MDQFIHTPSRLRPAISTPSAISQSRLTAPNPDNNHHISQSTPSQLNHQEVSAGSNNSNCATISPPTSSFLTLEQQIIPSQATWQEQQQPNSMDSTPNSNVNHGPAFEWMVRNLQKADALIQSKDAEINRFEGNEAYFKQELIFWDQKHKDHEQNSGKLRGEQNQTIAENNVELIQQNEELVNNVEQQKHLELELESQNAKLLSLRQDIVGLREQVKPKQRLTQQQNSEHNENIKNLEMNIVVEQEKVKILEEKLHLHLHLLKKTTQQRWNKCKTTLPRFDDLLMEEPVINKQAKSWKERQGRLQLEIDECGHRARLLTAKVDQANLSKLSSRAPKSQLIF